MSSAILNIKPEEINTAEKRKRHTISVIGCGHMGVVHAYLFAEAGFRVVCVDADQTRVNSITRGKMPFLKREIELKLKNHVKTGLLSAVTDFKSAVSQSDVVAIAVPVEIDARKKIKYSSLENTCKKVGASLRRDSLVIVISTIGVGVTQGLIKELLENTSGFKAGVDFGLAYSPIQVSRGQPLATFTDQKRIVAAADQHSLNAASIILESITKNGVKKTQNVKTAEAVTLFNAVQRDVKVALANEFAVFCEKIGIDYLEARKLVESDIYSTTSLSSLPYDDNRVEPYLLSENSDDLNLKLRIPSVAREVNNLMIKHAVDLTKNALLNCGKTLRRAKISLLGISQISNTKGPPKKSVKELAKLLGAKGAKVELYDPYFTGDELSEMQYNIKKSLSEALEGADCILILTDHDQFKRLNLKKLKVVMKMPAAIVDFEGVIEPDEVEKEGFIFRGFGRGVWKK
jgi:UDP-N-acetyl-D-mannosaminuronic acid dehydrogenase